MAVEDLKALRVRLDLSQEAVAEELGISQEYLSRLESGVRRNPRPVVEKAISRFIAANSPAGPPNTAAASVEEKHSAPVGSSRANTQSCGVDQ